MRFSALTARSLPPLATKDSSSSLEPTFPALTPPKPKRQPQPHHSRPSRTASPSDDCDNDTSQTPWTTVSKRHKKPNPASYRSARVITTSGLSRSGGIPKSNSTPSVTGGSTKQGANNNNNKNNEHNNLGSDNDDSDRSGNNNDENPNNKRPLFEEDPLLRDVDSHLPSDAQYFYLRGDDMVQIGDAMYKVFERTFNKKIVDLIRFVPTNTMTTPKPPDITKLADYPVNTTKHKKYFLCKRLSRLLDKINGYRYTICMYSTMSTVALKNKVLPVLWDYNLWMDSDKIWKQQSKPVAVILQIHTRLMHRHSLRDKVIAELTSMITWQTPPPSRTVLTDNGTGNEEFTMVTSNSDPNAVNIADINFSRIEKNCY